MHQREILEMEPALTDSKIVEKRIAEALPILDQLKEWMPTEYPKILPSSPIGRAVA